METDKDNIVMTAREWDHEYQNGFEDILLRDVERKRYEAIADKIRSEAGDANILDLGCGTGGLVQYLLHMNDKERIEYYGKMSDLEKIAGDALVLQTEGLPC